ncbi:hypothetical protein MLD38_031519 [Melastoma candidum]|uniref:Uncharacterized protein n=1 Tax=Melastoma candidum TaxID=119954 RepID=A0ACB9MPZ1_9MYRT|nr:hypothetical protein MLD38_031519 [Melastoma candidum]
MYLVGGCVRDLILKRFPKDFDIITSAELEVRNTFPKSEVIGRCFPICQEHVNDTTVEVSSFKTDFTINGCEDNLRLHWEMEDLSKAKYHTCRSIIYFVISRNTQASYFVSRGFKRRDKGSNMMLLGLFANLDKVIALLAFHNDLAHKLREPSVVSTFALAAPISKLKMMNEVDLAGTVKDLLFNMANWHYVSKVTRKYPQAPCSDLGFLTLLKGGWEVEACLHSRSTINYDSLMAGNLQEVCHKFARIVFDTIYPACHLSDPQYV